MRNTRLDELQAGIKIGERNINNFRYMDDTILMAESKEELKSLLMRVKEGSETAGLKLKKKKKKIIASSHITSWQIEEEKVEIVTDLLSWALRSLRMVTAARKSKDDYFLVGKL